jgi:nitrogen regulatory protein PII-like uncharacterized protein
MSSETVTFYHVTHYTGLQPKSQFEFHRRENLKSHVVIITFENERLGD